MFSSLDSPTNLIHRDHSFHIDLSRLVRTTVGVGTVGLRLESQSLQHLLLYFCIRNCLINPFPIIRLDQRNKPVRLLAKLRFRNVLAEVYSSRQGLKALNVACGGRPIVLLRFAPLFSSELGASCRKDVLDVALLQLLVEVYVIRMEGLGII